MSMAREISRRCFEWLPIESTKAELLKDAEEALALVSVVIANMTYSEDCSRLIKAQIKLECILGLADSLKG